MKKTKIFLGNAPWYKPGYYGVRAGSRWPHFEKEGSLYVPFPFFLAYATAVLEKAGFPVLLVDAIPLKMKEKEFYKKIEEFRPDIVVLETSTASFDNDFKIAKEIKEYFSPKHLIFCGPHHLMYRKEFLENQDIIDIVMIGEYEYTLLEIALAVENNADFKNIKGILYKKDGKVIKTSPRPLKENIDDIPWPARHFLPMEKYIDNFCDIPLPSLQMWASRGCPYQCIFCFWPQVMYGSNKYRVRDPKDVVSEIEYCINKYNMKSVYFDDDTFNIGKERIMKLAQELIDRKITIPWAIMARADLMDRELLEKLKESGLYAVKYGVESGVQKIVDNCKKNLDLKKVKEVCKITKELGIKMHLTFTFGLPGETWETAKKTIDFAIEMDPDTIQFSIVTPFPGSKFFEEMEKKGAIVSYDWKNYDGSNKAVIKTEHLSPEELEEIRCLAEELWKKHVQKRKFKNKKFYYLKKAFINPLWTAKKIKDVFDYLRLKSKFKL